MTDLVVLNSSVDYAIGAWLAEKRSLSGSEVTVKRYTDIIVAFRRGLQNLGVDLDGDRRLVRQAAQAFAENSVRGAEVSPATHNNRLAILRSFYEYVLRNELLTIEKNPIVACRTRKQGQYTSVTPLDIEAVGKDLAAIDCTSVVGKRDKAILILALSTGRRVTEVAHLALADITESGKTLTIRWPRTKGGTPAKNELDVLTSAVLREYLEEAIPLYDFPSGTIWRSTAWNGTGGKSLSSNALRRICEARLGTSRFHRLRHTFAHQMNEQGAKVTDIQAWLGHSTLTITGKYLQALQPEKNEYAAKLVAKLGIQ